MLKQVFACALFLTAVAGESLNAQELSTTPRAIEQSSDQKMFVPGTNYEVVLGSVTFEPDGTPSIQQFLAALVSWISTSFDLPATSNLPKVELVPASRMAALRHKRHPGWQLENPAASSQPDWREIVAVYDDSTQTIYLHESWRGSTAAELSIVVHEMVHHLQNSGNLKFACSQERERLAYEVQESWLGLFGRNLLLDFEIDPLTLLVSTKCGF